jgi:hypothetical protein
MKNSRMWFFVGLNAAALLCCAFLVLNLNKTRNAAIPTILYTASHSEMAPFQRVWNPDTNSDYSLADFSKDDDDAKDDDSLVVLCGEDGSKCPKIPAFSGEDYFDSKPIGLHLSHIFCLVVYQNGTHRSCMHILGQVLLQRRTAKNMDKMGKFEGPSC